MLAHEVRDSLVLVLALLLVVLLIGLMVVGLEAGAASA